MNERSEKLAALLRLSHDLGNPQKPLSILGEGNTSVRLSSETFIVKASGSTLATLREEDVVECRASGLLDLMGQANSTDADVERALMASRTNEKEKKPSVEALFHAWLLTLPGIEFVGHTHAPAVNGILCSPRAREFAEKRIVPDEIVCCDVESVLVPYTDPGLKLAQAIRTQTEAFMKKHGRPPRVVLLENHGIITIGRTPESVMVAMSMAEKTAEIWTRAAVLGGPIFLTPENVTRISDRPDESIRRKVLKM
jgi:rhamnose utilization protein RhaD (predicted bifunctional aldolase and dehydrogenase)